jgi:excinuclease ABC subunit B
MPKGDQIEAIKNLSKGINEKKRFQTLLGVTGSGKTYTIAKVIEKINKPTLILAHNKTLAAQLFSEFKKFFPNNSVEYFVSYYDYYQPESYIPTSGVYIEKNAQINDEIDKLRLAATSSLLERKDVIIVASVSCIYGLGNPEDYNNLVISLRPGMIKNRNEIIKKLIKIRYERNDLEISRNKFQVYGDMIQIFPANTSEHIIRIEFFGDEIEKISEINTQSGEIIANRRHVAIYPASHHLSTSEKIKVAIISIKKELEIRLEELKKNGKLIEEQRLREKTMFDIEMLEETGFCRGIENYSKHISGRKTGSAPFTLFDYFPKDFILIVDESHVTLPQVRAMYVGDKARKNNLIEYGFRLPSAADNRPLNFDEFYEKIKQAIFVSATPSEFEIINSQNIVEQIVRPTGLLDPVIEVRTTENQIPNLISEIKIRIEKKQRVFITTLTKKMAERLADYFEEINLKAKYLHSDIKTLERIEIIKNLRIGKIDVLIGINLLREGLDIPEVSLVAILDADKEGFLRSKTSLIQTIGRAARNSDGMVIMYANSLTESMKYAIEETNRRRKIQLEFNEKNSITPKTIVKPIYDKIEITQKIKDKKNEKKENKNSNLSKLTMNMKKAAKLLQFEVAAEIRNEIKRIYEEKDE